jgi:anhydro-N-acetylmuramic acid kinase
MKSQVAVGIMSGTSLDGLDLALCEFSLQSTGWRYKIIKADTIAYSKEWREKLTSAPVYTGLELISLHSEYGRYIGREVKKFLGRTRLKAELICSHGHTIFHQPENGFTFQLGDGSAIAATSGITTICDFRNLNIALGGQGAPLVPVGDEVLFSEYPYCLNLGGISNISYQHKRKRIAYDICPVNIILNHISNELDMDYDRDGMVGRKGTIHNGLLEKLNALDFYSESAPKSLAREWLEAEFLPVVNRFSVKTQDKLRTIYEHIAIQISNAMDSKARKSVLVTGGGAFNLFLIELLNSKTRHQIIIPDLLLVNYKEALIFAFLGVLRMHNYINCFSSVTGSRYDCSGGAIHKMV